MLLERLQLKDNSNEKKNEGRTVGCLALHLPSPSTYGLAGINRPLLFGCGLRRPEVAELKFEDIQRRDERWVILDLDGILKRLDLGTTKYIYLC
jgi:hypothetical protein